MSEAAAAPSAPAAAPAAPAAPAQSGPVRVGDFARVMEAKNAEANRAPARQEAPEQRQQEPQQQPQGYEQTEPDALEQLADGGEQPELENPDELPQLPLADADLLAKAREWENSDTLPEDFDNKLVEVKSPQGTEYKTVREMREGYMRQSDYQRGWQEVRQQQQQFQQVTQNRQRHFEEVRDPGRFLERYEDMGYGPVLEKVAVQIAERRVGEQRFIRLAGMEVMQRFGCDGNDSRVRDAMARAEGQLTRNRQIEQQNRQLQQERDQLAQRRQVDNYQVDIQQRTAVLHNQMAQLAPMAFRASGVHDNPANRQAFYRHLHGYVDTLPNWDGEYSRDHCMAAARILAEELGDMRQRGQQQQPRQRPRSLPAQRLGGRPGPQTQAGSSPGRKRPSEFAAKFMR